MVQKEEVARRKLLRYQEAFAGPGHWNDPDMLEVGNGGMTVPEYRAHFSLWVLLAAPLMAGNDVRSMSPEIKEILTNSEVIAMIRDRLGREEPLVRKDCDLEVWAKTLADGSRAVIVFNRGMSDSKISVAWEEIGYPAHLNAKVRDLWTHKDVGSFDGSYAATVPSHTVVMVKIAPQRTRRPPIFLGMIASAMSYYLRSSQAPHPLVRSGGFSCPRLRPRFPEMASRDSRASIL